MTDPASLRRRWFLRWLARGFLSLWGIAFAWVVTAFLKAPESRRSLTERIVKVGSIDSIPIGGAQLVRHGEEPILVIRHSEDELVAVSAVCTHLHCMLTWNDAEGIVNCPCHQGSFDINGNVLGGPPPGPLDRFRVDVHLGQIYLHV
jgi:cytochrome b6-f complex iron-sulfur subunit